MFERRLISNIKSVIDCKIELDQGRIYLYPEHLNQALKTLEMVFGIVSFSSAVSTKTDFVFIRKTVKDYIKGLISEGLISDDSSFAVRCRRVGEHEFTSKDMAAYCGSVVVSITGLPVDLNNPDFELYVEVRGDKTYIFHEKIPGPGGFPLGTQGRVVALVSGGIDSPVAAFLMMKRGCSVTILHFNNHPYTSESNDKVVKIVRKLKEYSAGSRLNFYELKYGEFLKDCIRNSPKGLTCVLCKSGMYKIAEKIAKRENALGIVDGSSLGQVASQTLPNLLATRHSVTIPILSPLMGLDKVEIEEIAKRISTYDISTLPESGCSAVPRYPETKADLTKVLETQKNMGIEEKLEGVLTSVDKTVLK